MSNQYIYDSFKISSLIALKRTVELEAHEQRELDAWLNESEANREVYARMENEDLRMADIDEMNSFNVNVAKDLVKNRIAAEKLQQKLAKDYRLWRWVAVAATVLVTLGAGIWFYAGRSGQSELVLAARDIVPGKNIATITLADGKVVKLSDTKTGVIIDAGKLIYNDSTDLAGLSSGAGTNKPTMLTLATPPGGTYQVTLPDGTRVWLNAASSLKFPSTFKSFTKRNVELIGEAYFEVAKVMIKDKGAKGKEGRMPFVVLTDKQKVEVLGTHFNINAYADEGVTKTTLLEGQVKVSSVAGTILRPGGVVLSPNEQATVSGSPYITVKNVDPDMAVAWKDGYFKFTDEPVPAIMRRLSRWYNVDIVYDGNGNNARFGGKISRDKNIAEVLEMLTSTKRISFKIEGRKIIVK